MEDDVDCPTVGNSGSAKSSAVDANSQGDNIATADHFSSGLDAEPIADMGTALSGALLSAVESLTSRLDLISGSDTATDASPVASSTETDARPFGREPTTGSHLPIQIPTDKESFIYNLDGPKRAIVFNHVQFDDRFDLKPRRGSDKDVTAIEKTFQSLGWQVDVINDAKLNEVKKVISGIQNSEDTKLLAAMAIFVLSHGEDNGTIFANDYMYRVDVDMVNQLTAEKCPGLAGKPKLFFVQACQGKETDSGSTVTRSRHTSRDSSTSYKIPNCADFLMFQASFWNHYSFRSCETGSWFIQALCHKIDSSEEGHSFFDILLEVSRSVALDKESNMPDTPRLHQKKQTPLLYSTLLRHIYLKGAPVARKAVLSHQGNGKASLHSSQSTLQSADARKPSRNKDCRVM